MKKDGFTLVELLAVIVILAIILAIAVPSISTMIKGASKNSFESSAKLLIKAINYKKMEDDTFVPTSITEENVKTALNIDNSNYMDLIVKDVNNTIYITIIGKNKWDGLVASGSATNMKVYDDGLVLSYDFMSKTNTSADKNIATDLSKNNYNGTLMNFGYTTTSGYNSGLAFDGVDDYISIGNIDLASLQSATVSFWRKASTTTKWLFMNGQDGTHFMMATQGTTAFYHSGIGSNPAIYIDGVANNIPKADGLWHHYLITNVDFTTWKSLALSNYSSFPYNNYLGNLKIYNRTFTVAEALAIYNSEKSKFGL